MYRTIATTVIAGLLLIGCSDQSSVNSPAVEKSTAHSLSKLDENNVFDVDQTVVNPETGESYLITGTITYEYFNDESEYSFFVYPRLEVRNSSFEKKEQSYIEQKGYVADKVVQSIIPVRKDYVIPGIPGNMRLRLDFSLASEVTMSEISIYVEPDIIIEEGR